MNRKAPGELVPEHHKDARRKPVQGFDEEDCLFRFGTARLWLSPVVWKEP